MLHSNFCYSTYNGLKQRCFVPHFHVPFLTSLDAFALCGTILLINKWELYCFQNKTIINEHESFTFIKILEFKYLAFMALHQVPFVDFHFQVNKREKYQDTPGCLPIYQNAPVSSKFTKLPLCPKKYTL